ncbi:hypothetical protein LINGRAHAP2_LOCUS4935 [Linum grandiflorum]
MGSSSEFKCARGWPVAIWRRFQSDCLNYGKIGWRSTDDFIEERLDHFVANRHLLCNTRGADDVEIKWPGLTILNLFGLNIRVALR